MSIKKLFCLSIAALFLVALTKASQIENNVTYSSISSYSQDTLTSSKTLAPIEKTITGDGYVCGIPFDVYGGHDIGDIVLKKGQTLVIHFIYSALDGIYIKHGDVTYDSYYSRLSSFANNPFEEKISHVTDGIDYQITARSSDFRTSIGIASMHDNVEFGPSLSNFPFNIVFHLIVK